MNSVRDCKSPRVSCHCRLFSSHLPRYHVELQLKQTGVGRKLIFFPQLDHNFFANFLYQFKTHLFLFGFFFTEGHLELVKYLLEARADVNAQTGTGDTALSFACERGKYYICAMFVHLLSIGTENNFPPCLVYTDVVDLLLIIFVKH